MSVRKKEVFQVKREMKEDASPHIYDMIASIQGGVCEYIAAVRELKDNLLFESKLADSEQELDIAEGDTYKSIKEAWVAAISGEGFGEISRVKVEIEARKAEEENQQFSDEWTK